MNLPERIVESLNLYGPMRVADFGAGAGDFALPIAQNISVKGVVWALDIQEPALEVLRARAREKNIRNIRTLRADLEKPNGSHLKNESVSLVLIAHTLSQTPERDLFLREAFRILKKNGTLVIVEWNKEARILAVGPKAAHRASRDYVRSALQKIGFSLFEEKIIDEHRYLILAKKQ